MKLLNFSIDDIHLETNGVVFDLHNAICLHKYSQDVLAGTFTLYFEGEVFTGSVAVTTRLKMLFHGLKSIRIFEDWSYVDPDLPAEEQAEDWPPPHCEALSLDRFGRVDEMGISNLLTPAESEARTAAELREAYKDHLVIAFVNGPELLISAETAEVRLVQSTRSP